MADPNVSRARLAETKARVAQSKANTASHVAAQSTSAHTAAASHAVSRHPASSTAPAVPVSSPSAPEKKPAKPRKSSAKNKPTYEEAMEVYDIAMEEYKEQLAEHLDDVKNRVPEDEQTPHPGKAPRKPRNPNKADNPFTEDKRLAFTDPFDEKQLIVSGVNDPSVLKTVPTNFEALAELENPDNAKVIEELGDKFAAVQEFANANRFACHGHFFKQIPADGNTKFKKGPFYCFILGPEVLPDFLAYQKARVPNPNPGKNCFTKIVDPTKNKTTYILTVKLGKALVNSLENEGFANEDAFMAPFYKKACYLYGVFTPYDLPGRKKGKANVNPKTGKPYDINDDEGEDPNAPRNIGLSASLHWIELADPKHPKDNKIPIYVAPTPQPEKPFVTVPQAGPIAVPPEAVLNPFKKAVQQVLHEDVEPEPTDDEEVVEQPAPPPPKPAKAAAKRARAAPASNGDTGTPVKRTKAITAAGLERISKQSKKETKAALLAKLKALEAESINRETDEEDDEEEDAEAVAELTQVAD